MILKISMEKEIDFTGTLLHIIKVIAINGIQIRRIHLSLKISFLILKILLFTIRAFDTGTKIPNILAYASFITITIHSIGLSMVIFMLFEDFIGNTCLEYCTRFFYFINRIGAFFSNRNGQYSPGI